MTRHPTTRLKQLCIALALPVAGALSCNLEVPTSVVVRSGPTCELSGSGRLTKFTVYAPRTGRRVAVADGDVSVIIWQIFSTQGYFEGSPVQGMRVVYGAVPQGYTQTIPRAPEKPKSLPLGVISAFFAEVANAPGIGGTIFMSPSGPVAVNVPNHCLRRINDREVEVDCETSQPYQEPVDIQKFVQIHRIVR
jgi:hypothetical protein